MAFPIWYSRSFVYRVGKLSPVDGSRMITGPTCSAAAYVAFSHETASAGERMVSLGIARRAARSSTTWWDGPRMPQITPQLHRTIFTFRCS